MLKKTVKVLLVILVLASALGGLGYWGFQRYQKNQEAKVEVRFTYAERGPLRVVLKETATLSPRRSVEIKSKIPGRIVTIHFEEGDFIPKGSVIAELEREEYEREAEEARRNYHLAVDKLAGLMPFGEVVEAPETIQATSSTVLVDTSLLDYGEAKVDYENKQWMFEEELISLKSLEDARLRYEKTYVLYHNAIRQASLEVSSRADTLQQAVENLSETVIRAPVDGLLTSLEVEQGELVQGASGMTAGTVIAEVADLTEMIAITKLNEVDIAKITSGASVELSLFSDDKNTYSGVVESIAPRGQNENGIVLFEVKISLSEKSDAFRPEMSANADILVSEASDVLKVPLEALTGRGRGKQRQLVYLLPKTEIPATPTPSSSPQPTIVTDATATSAEPTPRQRDDTFYSTDSAPAIYFEEQEVTVTTGLTNEVWAEIISSASEGVRIKLPDIKINPGR